MCKTILSYIITCPLEKYFCFQRKTLPVQFHLETLLSAHPQRSTFFLELRCLWIVQKNQKTAVESAGMLLCSTFRNTKQNNVLLTYSAH